MEIQSLKKSHWTKLFVTGFTLTVLFENIHNRHVPRGGRGEVSPTIFQKLEKSALIWRKNTLILVIYGYNFSFKTKFSRVSRRKTRIFFHLGAFFSRVVGECLSKCPNSNSPTLKKSWLRAWRLTFLISKPHFNK